MPGAVVGPFWLTPFPARSACSMLVDILKESKDETVLAVACADIGHYVAHFESGKKSVLALRNQAVAHRLTPPTPLSARLVNALGAKTRVMELMTHPNSDVRYRALMAVRWSSASMTVRRPLSDLSSFFSPFRSSA
jgi:hypothetical protein